MKTSILILLLLPLFSYAQITDEIFNDFFNRRCSFISFSQIRKYKIKSIKCIFKKRQYALKINRHGRKMPYEIIDSLGRKRLKFEFVPEYYIEIFDSKGMLKKGIVTDSTFECSKPKKLTYSQSSLKIFTLLERASKNSNEIDNFYFHDSLAKSIVTFEKASKTLTVTNYSDSRYIPKTYFLNHNFKLVKDSISADLGKYGGCATIYHNTYYQYDKKGILIAKSQPQNQIFEKRKYDDNNRITELIHGKSSKLKFIYENKFKVNSNAYQEIDLIEIEYY